ncbi:MAG: LUD domain-containing protein [Chloroflexota bacterium]|nr:LUD domain-containing protein [Chloroflexota bacterium]
MGETSTSLVERFRDEAAQAGALVHEARDVDDARGYILQMAEERGVTRVVKSRSTLAVEMGLRRHLEDAGMAVTEVDVGEWLAQLAANSQAGDGAEGEGATIERVAGLVSTAAGEEVEADARAVAKAARAVLRQCCIDADMGVSEASVAIAETGTLVIAGDEGGERLAAVLPRIHVTVVDAANVVATMDDASARLKGPGEMGQRMPRYVTYVTGRNTTADIPGALLARAQGPMEEHVVLVSRDVARRGV